MKKIILFAMFVMAIGFSACSYMDMPEAELSQEFPQSESIGVPTTEAPVLTFNSQSEFESAIKEIATYDSDEDKLAWVKNKYPDFKSIQTIYWEAMHEMAEIDGDSKDAYEAFKSKYSSLYFPNYMEDAGFYVPMSDLNASFLVNQDCKISIGGKKVNLKDINSYDGLMNLGRGYYAASPVLSRGAMGSFNINGTSMNSVGPEYDSGWTQYDDRKAKLKARRKFNEITLSEGFKGSESVMHLEFCFRKKTVFGWANYSSKSSIDFQANIPGTSQPLQASFSHSGTSSHDSELLYPIAISSDASNWYYTFAEAPCQASVTYQGVGHVLKYSWTMPGIQCVTPISARPAPILPHL